MPDEVSIIINNWTMQRRETSDAKRMLPQSPIISDNGHGEGHYPANTMVTCEINKY